MPYVTDNNSVARFLAKNLEGAEVEFSADIKGNKAYYPVNELDEKVNLMGIFKALSQICKSSKDILILGNIVEYANAYNEILIPNQSSYAKELDISRKQLLGVISRAEEVNLLHKLDTGRYLLNPYKVMSESACKRNYEHQELVQVRWKEETGLITELEMEQLQLLSQYLNLEVCLRPTAYNLNVANQYIHKHVLSDKQRKSILKHK